MSILNFFTYWILLNTLIPISLIVTIEFVKVVQSKFIESDALMFSWERDKLIQAKTAPLMEEIGQINYIFTDKTGTLTRNVMEFKAM